MYIPYICNFDEGFIPTYVEVKKNQRFVAFEKVNTFCQRILRHVSGM